MFMQKLDDIFLRDFITLQLLIRPRSFHLCHLVFENFPSEVDRGRLDVVDNSFNVVFWCRSLSDSNEQ